MNLKIVLKTPVFNHYNKNLTWNNYLQTTSSAPISSINSHKRTPISFFSPRFLCGRLFPNVLVSHTSNSFYVPKSWATELRPQQNPLSLFLKYLFENFYCKKNFWEGREKNKKNKQEKIIKFQEILKKLFHFQQKLHGIK